MKRRFMHLCITKRSENGAALLTVLLLVAVMSVIAAVMLDRMAIATRLAANGQSLVQARLYSVAAENLAMGQIKRLVEADPSRTTNRSGWVGREFTLPFENGLARGRMTDGGNCFNLNSVVTGEAGAYRSRQAGQQQFASLMRSLNIDGNAAQQIVDSLTDWVDSDQFDQPYGAEDNYYTGLDVPYRTPNHLVTDVTELRSIKGMTPDIYLKMRPWVCALPEAELSPINVNTLTVDRASLITMLAPQVLTDEGVKRVLAGRGPDGFSGTFAFWQALLPNPETLPGNVTQQPRVQTRYFQLAMTVSLGKAEMMERALIDASSNPPRLVHREWGEDL